LRTSTMSPASTATSVPAPLATPTSDILVSIDTPGGVLARCPFWRQGRYALLGFFPEEVRPEREEGTDAVPIPSAARALRAEALVDHQKADPPLMLSPAPSAPRAWRSFTVGERLRPRPLVMAIE
jgi:hypothetical protein